MQGFMTMAFLLPDIPHMRTGIEKVPYWPVYGIKMLARMTKFSLRIGPNHCERQGLPARTSASTAA